MALETKLVQKLSQSLLMTPQLQQAIKLLQLGRLEYLEAIQKELLENPLLEEVKESEAPERVIADSGSDSGSDNVDSEPSQLSPEASAKNEIEPPEHSAPEAPDSNSQSSDDWSEYLESLSDSRGAALPKGSVDSEERPSYESTVSRGETLTEYLLSQVRMADLQKIDEEIALNIIGNLDKNGYLASTHEEIAEASHALVKDVQRVLEFIQSLDPPGVAARNLQECLIIQLEYIGRGDALEAKIIQHHLDKLEKRKFEQIAKAEQVAVEEVYKAVLAIRQLEPRPGRSFASDPTRYVVPDIYVYKVGDEYVVTLNDDGLPRLRISNYYLDILRKDGQDNAPNKTYLQERLKAASWLIRSIHQRQQTIYRVTQSIVKFQKGFFDNGISSLKPLVLKDVADDIGMHESTVSRVTTNKYVHTPQGVFELKYFFSTGIKTAGGDVSSSSIKERIRNIIASEPPDGPISDQAIVDMLKSEKVDIARRTVAKYRESLGIPSSSKRRKPF